MGFFHARWRKPDGTNCPADSEDAAIEAAPGAPYTAQTAESMATRQLDRWMAAMERLRLADYVRYVDDRKRLFWTSFWAGVARGVGMAVGFSILGALLVWILQDLAKRNLPLIGELLANIVSIVQKRLQ